jgi:hypothetical protein
MKYIFLKISSWDMNWYMKYLVMTAGQVCAVVGHMDELSQPAVSVQ